MDFLNRKIYIYLFVVMVTVLMLYPVMPNDYISSLYPVNFNDKVEHGIVFFILAFLLNRTSDQHKKRLRNVIVLSLFGIMIELIQYYIPHRSTSISDALANIAGILVFQLLFSIYLYFIKRKRSHQ